MAKPCPFWDDDSGQCSSKDCSIGYCDDEVPPALRGSASSVLRFGSDSNSLTNGTVRTVGFFSFFVCNGFFGDGF